MTMQAGKLPEVVQSALDVLASPEPTTTEGWRVLAAYLTSPEAIAATIKVGTPRVTRLHLEMMAWVLHKGGERAA